MNNLFWFAMGGQTIGGSRPFGVSLTSLWQCLLEFLGRTLRRLVGRWLLTVLPAAQQGRQPDRDGPQLVLSID
jgi:hypothetical protein